MQQVPMVVAKRRTVALEVAEQFYVMEEFGTFQASCGDRATTRNCSPTQPGLASLGFLFGGVAQWLRAPGAVACPVSSDVAGSSPAAATS